MNKSQNKGGLAASSSAKTPTAPAVANSPARVEEAEPVDGGRSPRNQFRSKSPANRAPVQNEERPPMQDVFHPPANTRDQQMVDEYPQQDQQAQVISQKQQPSAPLRDIPARSLDDVMNDAELKLEIETDPELRRHMESIRSHIDQLKVGDLLKRVDSLVALNEVISATGTQPDNEENSVNALQQKALIRLCDELINAFTKVMIDIFSFPVKEIPLRFTKYFITIVNKTCSSKEIMKEVSCGEVRGLVEQLLCRLLIDNLDKIGQNKEGELILKNLNSSMLRMLENCNHTYIFVVLFGLLTKYKDSEDQPKIPSLIIKCLLKLSKNMDKLIDKIDLKKFMVAIHEYLVTITDKKTQNDDLGTRIAKTLINEIVKLKREHIWDYYHVIEQHHQQDNHLQKWIQIILKSLQQNLGSENNASKISTIQNMDQINQPQEKEENRGQSRMYLEFEIKKIVSDLKERNRYTNAIQRLDKFLRSNPQYDYKKHLVKQGLSFTQQVNSDLEKFRRGALEMSNNNKSGISDNNTTSSYGNNNGGDIKSRLQQKLQSVNSQNQLNPNNQGASQTDLNRSQDKSMAFKNKMSTLTKRQSVINQPIQGLQANNASQQNLNTSFSDMNQKLSNKWAIINQGSNKKMGGLTGREQGPSSNLANTMRNTTVGGSTGGGGNLLNTSSGGFKNRLQNRFQNKQQTNNNGSLGGGQDESGTIGQKDSPQKFGQGAGLGQQQQQQQQQQQVQQNAAMQGGQFNRSSGVAGGISNKSFRDRLKGLKGNQPSSGAAVTPQPGPGLAQTQGAPGGGLGGSSATNQDLQKRLADMKQKLHGLRNRD